MPRSLRCFLPLVWPRGCTGTAVLSGVAVLMLGAFVETVNAGHIWALATPQPAPLQFQRSTRTSSPFIGAAMAVLATLEDAGVLPPEGTPETNQIIRFVIQFQSVFTRSDDGAVQEFAREAMTQKHGDRAADIVGSLRTTGWTAEVLERLSDEEARRSPQDLQMLAQGFAPFNLSVEEFHRFMQLVRDARQVFRTRGLEFQTVFSSRRKEMPGAGSS